MLSSQELQTPMNPIGMDANNASPEDQLLPSGIIDLKDVRVTYKSPKKCRDVPCAVIFLLLTLPFIGYGAFSIYDFTTNVDICTFVKIDGIIPLAVSDTTAINVYDGCITYFVRGDPMAEYKCVQYGIKTLAAVVPINVSVVQSALENCVLSQNDPAWTEKCTKQVLTSVIPMPMINSSWNSCLGPLIRNESSAGLSCTQFSMDSLNSQIFPTYTQCASQNPSNPLATEQCTRQNLLPLLGEDFTHQVMDSCLVPFIEKDVLAGSKCYQIYLSSTSNTPQSNTFTQTCLNPLIAFGPSGSSGCFSLILNSTIGYNSTLNFFSDGMRQLLSDTVYSQFNTNCLGSLMIRRTPVAFTQCLLATNIVAKFCQDLKGLGMNYVDQYFSGFNNMLFINKAKLISLFGTVLIVGLCLAFFWMLIVARCAKGLIQITMTFTIISLIVWIIIHLIFGDIPGAVIMLCYLIFKTIWYICYCRRLQFTITVLKISLHAIKKNWGPFFIVFITFSIQMIICVLYFGAYLEIKRNLSSLVSVAWPEIVLLFSFFWTYAVCKNILAVTISGTVGTWYFYTKSQPSFPSIRALSRALFWSFGSIAFGSAVTAALSLVMFMYKKAKNTSKPWLKAFIMCFLGCIEYFLQAFNMYAFVQVALFGKSYRIAARDTFKLVTSYGIQALLNDDLIDGVLDTGRVIGGLTLLGVTGILAIVQYQLPWELVLLTMGVSVLFGFTIMSVVATVIEISSASIFICFVLNPTCLSKDYPKFQKKLEKGWLKWHDKMPKIENDSTTQ